MNSSGEPATIKGQLLTRFHSARKIVGSHWRKHLCDNDPYFKTREGKTAMTSVGQSVSNSKRHGRVDGMKRVVLAMEKLAGIPHIPIE